MSNRQCDRLVSAIARQPWAITPDALELVLGIAQRHTSDKEAVLAAPSARRESGSVRMRDGVAVISVMGPIFPRADFFTQISGATSIERLALLFGEAVAADDVKGIVLHIDSPGGQITGVHEFASQIFAARNIKPVIAYASGMCASAVYWIGSAAQRIVADATAELGSIGVVSAWTDDKEARKSRGLADYEVVSSQSPNKRLDPASEKGRSVLQRRLDEYADIFIADVARHRGKRTATVLEQFGQGGMMLAAEAVKVGMADEIGSLEGVIAALSGANDTKKTNRGALAARTNKETRMDRETLAQDHPELLAQIQAEARAEGKAEAAKEHEAALATATATTQAIVGMVAGEEAASYVTTLAAANLTAEQIKLMAPMLKGAGFTSANVSAAEEQLKAKAEDSGSRADVLAALRNATPAPVNASATPAAADPVQAAIDQISSLEL